MFLFFILCVYLSTELKTLSPVSEVKEIYLINETKFKDFEKKITSFSSLKECLETYLEECILCKNHISHKNLRMLLKSFVSQLCIDKKIKVEMKESWKNICDRICPSDFWHFYHLMKDNADKNVAYASFNGEIIVLSMYVIFAGEAKLILLETHGCYQGLGIGSFFLSHFIKNILYSFRDISSLFLYDATKSHNPASFNGQAFYRYLGLFFDCEECGEDFYYRRKKIEKFNQLLLLSGWKSLLLKEVIKLTQERNKKVRTEQSVFLTEKRQRGVSNDLKIRLRQLLRMSRKGKGEISSKEEEIPEKLKEPTEELIEDWSFFMKQTYHNLKVMTSLCCFT